MKKIFLLAISICFMMIVRAQVSQPNTEVVTDIDGNEYHTITIGTQVWMLENLKTTKYNDGEVIQNATGPEWYGRTDGAYCWYNNDINNKTTYGALYNWYTVKTGKLCPAGWHVPSTYEWDTMLLYLDPNANKYPNDGKQSSIAGAAMKETGLTHWTSPNTGATNSSGFTGLPGGWRDEEGTFSSLGNFGFFYMSEPYGRLIRYDDSGLFMQSHPKQYGYSVRCLRDSPPIVESISVSAIFETYATSGGKVTSDGGAPITDRGVCWSTSVNPTIANSKTKDGTGTGAFTSSLLSLTANTSYHVRAYATNEAGNTGYGNDEIFTTTTIQIITVPDFADIDGNIYSTVTIGSQVWMASNLKVTKYNDGTAIPLVTDNTAWNNLITPGYCWYNNDASTNKDTYGALYNWHAVNTNKLCPIGWHVPSDAEWAILTSYLGGANIAGRKLKETGTNHWYNTPNIKATNETGFTAVPGGNRYAGSFSSLADYFMCWSSTENLATDVWIRYMFSNSNSVERMTRPKQSGLSIRCIKDLPSVVPIISTTAISAISETTAISGGNINFEGDFPITARGICWSTSSNPTITGIFTTDGTGSGSFTSNLTGLTGNTTYYVRAYASNSIGTTYGSEITFTSSPIEVPVANAGADKNINEGATVTLDGTASSDPNNHNLTYLWTAPAGITLSSTTAGKPSFTAPEVMTNTNFTISLVVNDGRSNSSIDQVVITVIQVNKAPVAKAGMANAGADNNVNEGFWISLDGSVSSDPDNDALSYKWTAPAGISLSSTTAVNPTFLAPEVIQDTPLTFTLVVSDGVLFSTADQVVVLDKNVNKVPVANAGIDQSTNEGTIVTLDGSSSSDPDSSPLTYKWTAPSGITLSSTTAAKPTFIALEVSASTNYTFSLVVNDGTINSVEDQVIVTVNHIAKYFTPVWTGYGFDQMNINIYSAKLDGVDLEAGDELGIFDGSICVGVGTLTGTISQSNTLDIVVSKNDGSGNGYTPGNAISFKIYDISQDLEMDNVGAIFSDIDPLWSNDGKFAIGSTSFAALTSFFIVNQDITLNIGWNIISANVIPTNINLKDIFQTLIDAGKLKKVMDEAGKTIENFGAFGGWKNNIGNLNSSKGYKVNVSETVNLSLKGVPVQLPLDISLNAGWNIIPYPSSSPQDAKALVQTLIDAKILKKIMDEAGKTIENFGAFGGWVNNIGNFLPGKGYKVNVTSNCTLTIPASGTRSAIVLPELLASEHFKPIFIGNGTDHMNVYLINLQASGLQTGDEIGIFDGKLCVGSATIAGEQMVDGSISIAASANDELTRSTNGHQKGHLIELRLFRGSQAYELNLEKLSGSESFETNGSLFAQVNLNNLTALQIMDNSSQFSCYPNPFTQEITIEIQNLKQTKITVEIYSVTGQQIKNLYKGITKDKLILKWNGTNDMGQKVVPGVYLCKVNGLSKQVVFEGGK